MNKHMTPQMLALVACASFLLPACQKQLTTHHVDHPARVEHVDGLDVARVILTEKAIERIDLQTAKVEERTLSVGETVVPYSALIYDEHGGTWVYISPSPRTFQRFEVQVDRIEGNDVILTAGPEAGTVIATVGVAELYGTEFGVGH